MFNFFKKALPIGRSVLGVDIGTTSIKITEIEFSGKGKPALVNYSILEDLGHLERPNTALQTSALKLFDKEIVSYLQLMVKRAGFRSKLAVASLPSFSTFTTIIDMPPMSDEEIAKTLAFKARQYVPLPASMISLDWVRAKEGSSGGETNKIFLIAITNDQINKYKLIFANAGLNLVALEVEGFSLARSLTIGEINPVLIVDIGGRSTGLFVGQSGILQFSGQTDFASASLTRAVASGLGINNRRADDLKKQRGLIDVGLGPEQELSTLMRPILDVIINEARRVKENYENSYRQEIKKIVLTGAGAQLLGVESYFAKELGLTTQQADPFDLIAHPEKVAVLVKALGVTLSVSIGAALKDAH